MSARDKYLLEWVRKAEEDYEAALTLLRRRARPLPSVACFHCQQCAEKYLKALLVRHGLEVPRTHDLRELRRLLLTAEPAVDLITDPLLLLNPYAVEFRYPGEEATIEEAREAVAAMKAVRRFVRSRLGLERP